jgi:light-regulated signal transduction histidine kinase (bacteriophytochrome)
MLETESLGLQQISIRSIAQEVAQPLREAAQDRGVDIWIAEDLPVVAIDVVRLELLLRRNGSGPAIVQNCVRALSATVEIESAPGTGTTFTIVLPQHT